MNIVLEGCKASGKSTVASHFVNKGYEYFHSSSKTKNDLDYHLGLLDYDNRVIDRFSVGEMIYPTIYNRDGKLDWIQFSRTMNDRNTIYVILYASDINFILDRITTRGRETYDENYQFIKKSNELFKFIGQNFKNRKNILLFDVCKYEPKEIIRKVEELI